MARSVRDSADSALEAAWTGPETSTEGLYDSYAYDEDGSSDSDNGETETGEDPVGPSSDAEVNAAMQLSGHADDSGATGPSTATDTSHYVQTMREAGVVSPPSSSSSSAAAAGPSASASPSSMGSSLSDDLSDDVVVGVPPLHDNASSSTSVSGGTAPLRRPGQPQFEGFWQVHTLEDLRPMVDNRKLCAKKRRADPAGGYVSPIKALTSYLHHTYHLVNHAFVYELSFNPRRVLTKPSKPMYNDGHDNEDSDYILYVNDYLGSEEGHRYLILDVLGQGTFGQVVKCQNMSTHEIVAVKVIKNKTAYFNQSMMEVTILETLNQHWDPEDAHNILRLRDTFIHAKHLCLVFELLSSNLYELIKQNSFRGLSTSLVRVFITQLLDALVVLKKARLIHCDLKPENILLRTLQAPSIKLVDFGSACHEEQTVYTYIQSRFYRSPEVLLGLPYTGAIDMWSLGCIAAELFLGLPIFPGTSEYNQVSRIVDMLGLPPAYMLERGRQTHEFFNTYTNAFGATSYQLKSLEQFSREHRVQEQVSKQYFPGRTLEEIVRLAPLSRRSGRSADTEKEMANRAAFTDFVAGLLNLDPHARWTPQQAKQHPFITGEPFTGPWQPPSASREDLYRRSDAALAAHGYYDDESSYYASTRGAGAAAYDGYHRAESSSYKTAALHSSAAYSNTYHAPATYDSSGPNGAPDAVDPNYRRPMHMYPASGDAAAWAWSHAATPLASAQPSHHPAPPTGAAAAVYAHAPPAAALPSQGSFSVVVHDDEPYAPDNGAPYEAPPVAYSMPYAPPRPASHNDVYTSRFKRRSEHDPKRDSLLPMYVNQRQ